ncbi:hypothetical protein [Xenophilus sp. Marseille-Q4582]|uniref:hypothetical protein n=1 Tax=Xenophilus sp. Marseille-Q4582 TaxID=2866600 RepID=UPI001CE4446F|nr:hypothetical protein [Xenophilus sp. Marseille-Q4582]
MHIIVIAWLYVALMMAVAEGMSTQGSVLGAVFTFLLYGALPIALVVYLLATPARKRARRAREAAEAAAARQATAAAAHAAPPAVAPGGASSPGASDAPDQGREAAAGDAVAPERKEP